MKGVFRDRELIGSVAAIAVPVSLQMLLSYITGYLDTAMIGSLGTAAISAVGLAAQFFSVCSYLVYGLRNGTGILLSQFFGSGDILHMKKTLGIGLCFALGASMIFFCAGCFAPQPVMRFYTDSETATSLGVEYLRIVSFSYPVYAISCILEGCFCSERKAKYPVMACILAIAVNLCLNYCLIYGKFGFPALGVRGAAIATVISRVAELAALVFFGFRYSEVFKGSVSDCFGWSRELLKNYVSHAVPVVLTELVYSIGTNFYFVAYGRMGDDAVASLTIAESIRSCVTVLGNGLYSATGVLVGNELGAGHLEKAQKYAARMLTFSLMAAGLTGALLLLTMKPMLSMFSVSEDVLKNSAYILLIDIVIAVIQFYYGVIIVGILPAGGDTRASFLIDVGTVWFIGLPMAFLGVMVFHLPVWAIYGLVGLEHLMKLVLCEWRYRQKKWVKNLTGEV